MLKQAFLDGAKDALAGHGLGPKHEKSTLRKALPYLAAGGAALAGYKHLRTPTFAANPALREMQELASREGFHRLIDVTHRPGSKWFRPMVDAEGKLSPWNKLKLFAHEGTTEAIPFTNTKQGPQIVGKSGPVSVEGVTHARRDVPGLADIVRGGVDLEGSPATRRATSRLGRSGKEVEADLLQRHAPGSTPETYADLEALTRDLPADRTQAIKELQARLTAAHGSDVLLKPTHGIASGGKFPRGTDDWGSMLGAYDQHAADPTKGLALRQAGKSKNSLAAYLRTNGIYEGHVLNTALHSPDRVLAQRLIENPMGEYRVHAMAGEAPMQTILPRFSKNPITAAKAHAGLSEVNTRDMKRFIEDTLRKLPPEYQGGHYGIDVMAHRRPDGSIGYKIIEMNPHASADPKRFGSSSGLLDPGYTPLTGNLLYRAATGRHTPLIAGLGAAGAAGLADLGVSALTGDDDRR